MKTRRDFKTFASEIFAVADVINIVNVRVVADVCVITNFCDVVDVCVVVVLVVDSFTARVVVRALALLSTSAMILSLETSLSTSPSLYFTVYV